MEKNKDFIKNNSGFTLIELMLTLVISTFIAGAIYSAYRSQQHTQLVQEQVTEMQQNLRAAMMRITNDIRMAGYDPTSGAGATIIDASQDLLSFSQDVAGGENDGEDNDKDGNIDAADNDEDYYGDGQLDDTGEFIVFDRYLEGGVSKIGKTSSSSSITISADLGGGHREENDAVANHQPIAENIEAIEFFYTLADGTTTRTPGNPDDIRSIQISILARAARQDPDFTNGITYTPASGVANNWGPYNDNYRRRLLTTRVNCRNMGL